MDNELRIEVLHRKILNIDTYIREMMKLNLSKMDRIKHSRHRLIRIDTDDSDGNTAGEETANIADGCQHE